MLTIPGRHNRRAEVAPARYFREDYPEEDRVRQQWGKKYFTDFQHAHLKKICLPTHRGAPQKRATSTFLSRVLFHLKAPGFPAILRRDHTWSWVANQQHSGRSRACMQQ